MTSVYQNTITMQCFRRVSPEQQMYQQTTKKNRKGSKMLPELIFDLKIGISVILLRKTVIFMVLEHQDLTFVNDISFISEIM